MSNDLYNSLKQSLLNITMDRYLQKQYELNDGWIPLKTLATLKMVKKLLSTGMDKEKQIFEALKRKRNEFEFSSDRKSLKCQFIESLGDEFVKRTLYLEGFGFDLDRQGVKHMVEQALGSVGVVTYVDMEELQIKGQRKNRGFCFIEFVTAGAMEEAIGKLSKYRPIRKQEWLALMAQYKEYRKLKTLCLRREQLGEKYSDHKADVLVRFKYTQRGADGKILSKLFSAESAKERLKNEKVEDESRLNWHVEFVDTKRKIVRLRTSEDSRELIECFNDFKVYHSSATDSVGSFSPPDQSNSEKMHVDIEPVELELVPRKQQLQEWDHIIEQRKRFHK